jgi:hypothetical protein
MQTRWAALGLTLCTLALVGQAATAEVETDRWSALSQIVGDWSGTASGRSGEGTVTRKYTFIMGERFIEDVKLPRYPSQEKNKVGEVHEHRGFFSYDKARKLLLLRQFHAEGFVNT